VPRLKRRSPLPPRCGCSGPDREVVVEAYPGDVVGLGLDGTFTIGDTISDADLLLPAAATLPAGALRAARQHARRPNYKQF